MKLFRKTRRGFSLIELMIVLIIIGWIMVLAVNEYLQHLADTRITRAKADLDEIAKTIRLYNIREEKPFPVATLTFHSLGGLIGSYFEKEPPKDPWGHPYFHNPKMGLVYSLGEDGKDGFLLPYSTDDIIVWYLPQQFFISKAEYNDVNQNNQVDFGDILEISFSRPARMKDVTLFDFTTSKPEKSLGSAIVRAPEEGPSLQIYFNMPIPPHVKIGETTIRPRGMTQSIQDFSTPPMSLDESVEVPIKRKRM